MDEFCEIMNLPHHVSQNRRHMTLAERAAQFSAFAALTGYDDEIRETARLTDMQECMAEDDLAELNAAFFRLVETESERPQVTVTYFQPDARKNGGAYRTYSGQFRHYDAGEGKLYFTDGTVLPAVQIQSILFSN